MLTLDEWNQLFVLCGKAAEWMDSLDQPLKYDSYGMPLCIRQIAYSFKMERELNAFTSRCYNDLQPL